MLGEYQREWLRPDVLAGLTTAAVISTATTIAVLTGSVLGLAVPDGGPAELALAATTLAVPRSVHLGRHDRGGHVATDAAPRARVLGGRRGPAVAVMSLGLLAILVVPLVVAIDAIIGQADAFVALLERLPSLTLPAAPAWLDSQAGGFAAVIVHFILMVILTAVLYSGGESWAAWARGFGRRLADEHGERMVLLAGGAIRGVAMGVVVTAIMFALCIAQLGPLLVLLSAAAWVYYSAGAGWGTFMLVWALAVGLMDNFVRPILIRRGADLPPLLIFAGVIGGLVAFGIVGIFVGPVVLAVSYTLLDSWVAAGEAAHEAAPRTTGTP